MSISSIRLATRASPLALWQANRVSDLIRTHAPDTQVELVSVSTSPDRRPDTSLAALGGDKGLFVAEVEQAIRDGRADAAIHSLKDVPGELPNDMALVAFPERANTQDALVSVDNVGLAQLPRGAHVGTSALRRRGQLLRLRPDLQISEIRGNVDTRVRKLRERQYDAIVLASAGLHRLGLEREIAEPLTLNQVLCAAGQGAIAIEAKADSPHQHLWRAMDDPRVRICVEAEREFVRELGADCNSAAACLCEMEGENVHLRALVISPDGTRFLEFDDTCPACAATDLGRRAAQQLLDRGAAEILST
ncbi:MAG: hydroxymethylbilane synthase [Candidatus Sumerlaeaceae bacterium]